MRFGAPNAPTPGVTPDDPKGFIQCHGVKLTGNHGRGYLYFEEPNTGDDDVNQTEDCLFLDIYVTASLFSKGSPPPSASASVVVWFYGGAFVAGSKDGNDTNNPLYTGVGAINAANALDKPLIFVAGNYRLGAFGWLAGEYMEKVGTPNAGLLDQRLLLKWVQDYIYLVGGDNSNVSAWGESAGASSLLHHLVLNDGQTDPHFKKAFIQSPAYEILWDTNGTLNKTYQDFVKFAVANCTSLDISCLRAPTLGLDDQNLVSANQQLVSQYKTSHIFPVGPSVDGSLIKSLPAIRFASKLFWHNLQSLVISHVKDESGIFVPKSFSTDSDFTTYVSNFLPQSTLSSARSAIASAYPSSAYNGTRARVSAVIRDSSFTCNVQQLFQAYSGINVNTYVLSYDFELTVPVVGFGLTAAHGTDLLPTFWNQEVDFAQFLRQLIKNLSHIDIGKLGAAWLAGKYAVFSPKYQAYLVSNALFDNFNSAGSQDPPWTTATATGTSIGNVMLARATPTTMQFTPTIDLINTSSLCDFWTTLAAQIAPTSTVLQTPAPTMADGRLDGQEVLGELK